MPSKFPTNPFANILNQPKAELILKSYGLSAIKKTLYTQLSEEETDDKPDGTSRFGTPIFDNIILLAPNYFEKTPKEDAQFLDQFGNPNASASLMKTQPVTLAGNIRVGEDGSQVDVNQINSGLQNSSTGLNAMQLNTVLIEVTQTKNVVTTAISGANGTVKEYIGDGDYQIKLRGFVETDSMGRYPAVDVGILSSYLKAPVPITIVSNYLRNFNIDKIVVLDYNFPQTEGRRNLQFFEINAVSDKELEAGFIKDL